MNPLWERLLRFRWTFRFKANGDRTLTRITNLFGGKAMEAQPEPWKWKWFKPHEVEKLNERLIEMLEVARVILGQPIVITSGWRSPDENKAAGGVKNSAHEKGLGVDIRTRTKQYQDELVDALKRAGFVRIGRYDKHVHADIDESLPQVAWAGGISHA
jgi:zinc D-Ala-D-Ala carboxypeptidase